MVLINIILSIQKVFHLIYQHEILHAESIVYDQNHHVQTVLSLLSILDILALEYQKCIIYINVPDLSIG